MTTNEKKPFDFDDIEDAVLPSTATSTASASATDTHNESLEGESGDGYEDDGGSDDGDEDADLRETGVHEHGVDALLAVGQVAEIPNLTAAEELTVQVKSQFSAILTGGEELLRDSELQLGARAKAIEACKNEIDMMLDKEAIKGDEDLLRKGRDLRSRLITALELTLLRACLEPSGTTPSTLPDKIQGVADHELERMALGLNELSLKAVTAEAKKGAEKLLEMIEGDKSRRASRVTGHEPTQAVSITPPPPPPVEERQPLIVPPASAAPVIETAWQSGPEAAPPANEVVTQDAPLETAAPAAVSPAPAAPSKEPSMSVSPSMENEMVKNEEPSIPVVIAAPVEVRTRMRVGRARDNEWVIDQPHISAHHALLTINEGSLQIEDLGSTHGTFVLDELANWVRIAQGTPAIVKIGQRFRFANIEAVSSHDESKRTNVHFVKPDGKFSHSIGFFFAGEQQSELHRLEQERLNAEDAAKHPKLPMAEKPQPKLRSPTEMQQSIAKSDSTGSGLSKALGVGMLIIGALALLTMLFVWGIDGFNRHNTVATTETETSTESETSTPTETVTETETSTPIVSETPSPTAPTGFTCRPGRERAGCDSVEHFRLGGGTGGRWDCSELTYEQYRDVYRPTEPVGASPHVIANVCACQWCEPNGDS
jgi:hypothetical protein